LSLPWFISSAVNAIRKGNLHHEGREEHEEKNTESETFVAFVRFVVRRVRRKR
jgi:hypothetical protein